MEITAKRDMMEVNDEDSDSPKEFKAMTMIW
jgi:hypothetical protein